MRIAMVFIGTVLSACVDVPGVPVDGQIYLCTISDAGDDTPLFQVERCGPLADWTVPAEAIAAEVDWPRAVKIYCDGTHRSCNYEEPSE